MRRREVIAALGAVAGGGCLTFGAASESGVGAVAADAVSCGEFCANAGVVWHEDNRDAAIRLVPSATSVALPSFDLTFTLHNGSDTPLETNFYDWTLSKRVDGSWYRLGPTVVPSAMFSLDPGDSHRWTLHGEGGLSAEATGPLRARKRAFTVGGIGGGEYAFAADARVGEGGDAQWFDIGARFTVEGDRLVVEPTDTVGSTRVDGDRLLAEYRSDYRLDARPRTVHLAVVEEDPPSQPRELVAEQLVRRVPLRDAIALARRHPVRAVSLLGVARTHPAHRIDGTEYYRYRDSVYAVWAGGPGDW